VPITEADRHHLLNQLETTIGKKAAMTLAEHLPPVGWADVATKTDLEHLRIDLSSQIQREVGRLDGRIGQLDGRIGQLEGRVGALEGRVESLEVRIGSLEMRVGRLETRMDRIETKMDQLETRMDRIETKMDRIETRMGALENRMDTLETSLTQRMHRAAITSTVATVSLVLAGMQLVG
jgi:chromosome segregation ATPase